MPQDTSPYDFQKKLAEERRDAFIGSVQGFCNISILSFAIHKEKSNIICQPRNTIALVSKAISDPVLADSHNYLPSTFTFQCLQCRTNKCGNSCETQQGETQQSKMEHEYQISCSEGMQTQPLMLDCYKQGMLAL